MVVGGRWSGWGRAWAHTSAYIRSYLYIGLLTSLIPPIAIVTYLLLLVVLPGACCANLLFVRLFPKVSWTREPRRAWFAAGAGVPLVGVGVLAWISVGSGPPAALSRLGEWGEFIYIITIPVFLSNLGVLIGYLIPRAVPSSGPPSSAPPPAPA